MATQNAANERLKRRYFIYLRQARHYAPETVDRVAAAMTEFEADTEFRDFKAFRWEHAVLFKEHLTQRTSSRTAKPLSKATLHARLTDLKQFFQWLAGQPGFRRLRYSDAEYFSLSENDRRIATAQHHTSGPTLEQLYRLIDAMPGQTVIERRDRAVIALIVLTGARVAAVASFKLKDVDLAAGRIYHDARHVRTKFRKTFDTFFFGNVNDRVRQVFEEWVQHLRDEQHWGDDDPLFPATAVDLSGARGFVPSGLLREHWRQTTAIRRIFRRACSGAGLPYFNPHSIRHTLVAAAQTTCRTPEEFKAVSQNLGHNDPLTTFTAYGAVKVSRQGELVKNLGKAPSKERDVEDIVRVAIREYTRATSSGRRPRGRSSKRRVSRGKKSKPIP